VDESHVDHVIRLLGELVPRVRSVEAP
jgi:hypothetical protein